MARVTKEEVLAIMSEEIKVNDTQMNALIRSANAVINEAFRNSTGTSAELLKELECWLTAHFITVSLARLVKRERLGEAEVEFAGKWGEGLHGTPYGQQLLLLDIEGRLAKLGRAGASMYAVPNFNR